MLIVIDNYDSFTYNLVQAFGQLGAEIEVHRNDQIGIDQLLAKKPDRIVISPGPGTPAQAGISLEVIKRLGGVVPLLGVCLGHQCIGEAFGARVVRADRLMHGKTSEIRHDGQGVFEGLPTPFWATRYHSLIIDKHSLPPQLEVTAFTDRDEVMGVRHRELPIEGVQFHPESFLTEEGLALMENFLK
ncbi:MAG: aminodeoxychorismate/anthranilate synthase component II [Planctomycetota bacterium]